MIKIVCDRCGEEVKFGWNGAGKEWATKMEFNEDKYHLCPKCFVEFTKWKDASSEEKRGERVK